MAITTAQATGVKKSWEIHNAKPTRRIANTARAARRAGRSTGKADFSFGSELLRCALTSADWSFIAYRSRIFLSADVMHYVLCTRVRPVARKQNVRFRDKTGRLITPPKAALGAFREGL